MSSIFFYVSTTATLTTLLIHALNFSARTLNLPILEFYGRSLASFVALLLCAIYGTIASAILSIFGYGGLGQWTTARAFKWCMLLFTGVWCEIEFEDEEDAEGKGKRDWLGETRPAVFLGNHQTELDVLVLGHVFPRYCSVTAKKSLKFWPFLGWFMAMSKTVFIERKSRAQAMAAFDDAAAQMRSAGQSVYIFPEGTRSYYEHPDLLPFKKGAFHLAVQAQVPIVPIVVANYSNVLNVKKKVFRPGIVPIKVLKPISTKGKTKEDVDALLNETREKMLAELKRLTERARREGVALKVEETSEGKTNGRATGVDLGTEKKVLNAAA